MKQTNLATLTEFGARSINRRRSGAAVIEFVLVLFFVLLPLTFGAIEYSYLLYVKNTLQAAARETARAGIVDSASRTEAENAGKRVLTAAFSSSIANQCTFTWTGNRHPGNTDSGQYIEVTVRAPNWSVFGIRPLGSTPLYSHAAPAANKRLTAVATMRRE